MTAWVTLATGDLDPESPWDTTVANAVYNNVIAAFEKAVGAPQLAANYVVTSMIADGAVTPSKMTAPVAGDYVEASASVSGAEVDALVGTSYAEVIKIKIARTGQYRIRSSSIGTAIGTDNGFSQVHKNGSPLGVEQSGVARVWQNETFNLTKGDILQLYAKTQLASQEPDGSFYLIVCVADTLNASQTYTDLGYV